MAKNYDINDIRSLPKSDRKAICKKLKREDPRKYHELYCEEFTKESFFMRNLKWGIRYNISAWFTNLICGLIVFGLIALIFFFSFY